MMTFTKPPTVAGQFYPASRKTLISDLGIYLDQPERRPCPKAIIAPHAGYIYSGPIAGSAYGCLQNYSDQITRVLLFGPAHRQLVTGLAVSTADAFGTLLGNVPVDTQLVEKARAFEIVQSCDEAFELEHCLEVQLPFLQQVLNNFSIVPFLASNAPVEKIAEVMEALWGGPETLIVISSDLSHYHDDETAKKMDTAASQAINSLDWRSLSEDQACGCLPIKALLQVAKRHSLTAETVDLRNSGDTAGPKDSVVGYGAFHFVESTP